MTDPPIRFERARNRPESRRARTQLASEGADGDSIAGSSRMLRGGILCHRAAVVNTFFRGLAMSERSARAFMATTCLAVAALGLALVSARSSEPKDLQSFRVPFRTTDTNHYLVRTKLNGKGPFNFLVDTGAPAFFISEATAKAAGVKRSKKAFWAKVDRVDFEGGPQLRGMSAWIEDPFQLVGMNALGLPGARIDGILGYTILARFRIELDPTADRMTWTRLNFDPPDPPAPPDPEGNAAPAEVQAMSLIGGAAKLAALFTGKQPEEKVRLRGLLGVEVAEEGGKLKVSSVLGGSPADGKFASGDWIKKIAGKSPSSLKQAREILAKAGLAKPALFVVDRDGAELELRIQPAGGF